MVISFLGTSAGWPLPRLGCNCSICLSNDPKDKRLRPSILVNNEVLIDSGPDIYHQISRLKEARKTITNIKALILTHSHEDHILGFNDLTHIYSLENKPKLFLTQETLNGLRKVHSLPVDPFKIEVIRPLETFMINQTKFNLFPVEHSSTQTFGIKIKGNKLVAYIPDLRRLPKSQEKTCRDLHLLILDGSSLGQLGQSRNHQSIQEGLILGQKLKAKQVYFTHIGHKTGQHEEIERFVQSHGGKQFHVAFDGEEIDL